jgi:hypothetical protein
VLRFVCPHCSVKLTAREDRAGRTASCPRCKKVLTIPSAPELELQLVRSEPSAPLEPLDGPAFHAAPPRADPDATRRDRQQAREILESLGPEPEPEHTGNRKVFWLMDILLYPFSITGIVTLALMIGWPLMTAALGRTFFVLARLGSWLTFGIGVLLGLYTLWYMAECVYDSAKGGTRAPEIMDADTSFNALWSRAKYLLTVYFVYVAPVLIYRLWSHSFDAIFWALAAWAVLFAPMSLLAMVINDSFTALNPFFLIAAIARVLLSYAGLLVCLLGMVALMAWISAATVPPPTPRVRALLVLSIVSLVADSYGAFLFAHILGRFYWRNRERLDWGI